MGQSDTKLVKRAQAGDELAREQLINSYRSYIKEVASGYCSRKLEWENDDELSIALLAFNKAIDDYRIDSDKNFKNYTRMVIRSRLIDYFRKEARHSHISLDAGFDDREKEQQTRLEAETAWNQYNEQEAIRERAEELQEYQKLLAHYGLSFRDLERSSPKHKKTRDRLVKIAEHIASRRKLLEYIRQKKKLPVKELILSTGVSKKVLKRGRKYIIAVTLIIADHRFSYLRSLLSLPAGQQASRQSVGGSIDKTDMPGKGDGKVE